jgi:hypothetical protein
LKIIRTIRYNRIRVYRESLILKMHREKVKNSVYYILQRTKDLGFEIGKTKLIKLLYLLDLENFRSNKKTDTELNWIFYKYGPYAFELEEFLENIGVIEEEIPTKGGRVFLRLGIDHQEEVEIGIEKRLILDSLIKEWGDASLSELLDYVYFDTEPMMEAQTRGETLNFDFIKPQSYYAVKGYKIDEKQGQEITNKIREWELAKKNGR